MAYGISKQLYIRDFHNILETRFQVCFQSQVYRQRYIFRALFVSVPYAHILRNRKLEQCPSLKVEKPHSIVKHNNVPLMRVDNK